MSALIASTHLAGTWLAGWLAIQVQLTGLRLLQAAVQRS